MLDILAVPRLRWLGRRLLAVEARVQPQCIIVHAGFVVLKAVLIHVLSPKLRFPVPVIIQPVLCVRVSGGTGTVGPALGRRIVTTRIALSVPCSQLNAGG